LFTCKVPLIHVQMIPVQLTLIHARIRLISIRQICIRPICGGDSRLGYLSFVSQVLVHSISFMLCGLRRVLCAGPDCEGPS
jgi:hypothetical protein